MTQPPSLSPLHTQLIRQAQAWALGRGFDAEQARQLRHQAILENHAHYFASISVYRRFCDEEGVDEATTVDTIQQRLMLPDDIFKSYSQEWLDEGNFERMTTWLREIFHQKVDIDLGGVSTIDEWIERLAAAGLRMIYSSGTSGNFSFVPRDLDSWSLFTTASSCMLAPLMLRHNIGGWLKGGLVRSAVALLPPATFARLSRRMGLRDYDAFFLDFASGHTGNQTLEQELSRLFRRVHFLYETRLSPTVLRLLGRGPRNEQEVARLRELQDVVVTRRDENYAQLVEHLRRSTAEGQKVFIFGTPQQYKELCDLVLDGRAPLAFNRGSVVLFGGGWKSFTGERISREELVSRMQQSFGLPPERIMEGYSMTEINAFMLRCQKGRFHIPPTIEPVIFDEQLRPLRGQDLRGVFGFQDSLARAVPGFLISGDEVRFVDGECPCGLSGPAVTEIGRARSREVKGCGGIMASLRA